MGVWAVGEYYVTRLPEYLVLLLPIVLLLALLYAMTTHSRHQEYTAMRAAGISLWRFCLPYFGVGFALSGLVFGLSDLLRTPHEKLIRTAAFGGPGGRVRRALYDYIKRNGACGVAILNGVLDEATPNDVALALHELTESKLLKESTREGGLVWEVT